MLGRTALGFSAILLVPQLVAASPISLSTVFNADFAAEQSLWQGGPNAGIDEGGRTGGSVGLYYDVKANTGTVEANQNGSIAVNYLSETTSGSPTSIQLEFNGDPSGGTVSSAFGATVQSGVFLDVSGCVGDVAFGICIGIPYNIDQDVPIFVDRGFFLEPSTTHTPVIDAQRSDNDAAAAFGVGVLNTPFGSVGPTMNLDLDQTIFFTPTGVSGTAFYQNQTTGEMGSTGFVLPTDGPLNLQLNLSPGVWDISFQNVMLLNSFRNDINLELRPSLEIPFVVSWPPAGHELFGFGLIDETFALNFNTIGSLGSIQLTVLEPAPAAAVPEPGTLSLMAFGAAGLLARRRKSGNSART